MEEIKLNKIDIKTFGCSDYFAAEAGLYKNHCIGRVVSQFKDLYKVICENGEMLAVVSGKFRYNVKTLSQYPAVGDFVVLDRNSDLEGNAVIHAVLRRKSAFVRKMAGTSNDEQIVASNIDTVFICMSLNNDFNLRRLERYLSITWESGAIPVVVLTKSDLCENINQKLNEVNSVAIGVDIIVTSSIIENGYLAVLNYTKENQTVAFVGSSGVGKSTLINRLVGESLIKTKDIRSDDKGRHTTTRRELIKLPNGSMVIDTPGMREIGLEGADLVKSFVDIDKLAAMCKFSNCTHGNEPDCAVQKAVSGGVLSSERLLSYQRLKKEAKYDGLNSRQIEHIKFDSYRIEMKAFKKSKNKKK